MRFSLALALALPVLANAACAPLHFVYARATTEPPTDVDDATPAEWEAAANAVWSKGYGAAGFSILGNTTQLLPSTTGWPVHYPASFSGCDSIQKGVADYIDQLTKVAAECPDTKFALGGHSQGGFVTVKAIAALPANILARVTSITMVGAPPCPASVRAKCRSYCNLGDLICQGSGIGLPDDCESAARMMEETWMEEDTVALKEMNKREVSEEGLRAPDCSGREPAEKGHWVRNSDLSAHLAYNEDGHYIFAAACFIKKQFEAAA